MLPSPHLQGHLLDSSLDTTHSFTSIRLENPIRTKNPPPTESNTRKGFKSYSGQSYQEVSKEKVMNPIIIPQLCLKKSPSLNLSNNTHENHSNMNIELNIPQLLSDNNKMSIIKANSSSERSASFLSSLSNKVQAPKQSPSFKLHSLRNLNAEMPNLLNTDCLNKLKNSLLMLDIKEVNIPSLPSQTKSVSLSSNISGKLDFNSLGLEQLKHFLCLENEKNTLNPFLPSLNIQPELQVHQPN